MGLKEETIIKIIEECIKPLSGLKNGFEKQENRADEITEDLPAEKYPSVSAVIAFVKNKIEVFSEAVGKVYLKATDFEDYKTDASNTYVTKTDVEDFENNVADTYATKTDVEDFEKNVAETYATKTDVEDFENNVAETYATKTDVEDFENNVADTYATKNDVKDLKTDTEVIATATGSAITVNSSQAPLPQLKLSGKTTKDETLETLSSTGDSGSFEVGVYGRNILDITIGNLHWNGIPITNNGNNSVTLNGTSNANWTKYILGTAYLPKGKYKIMNYGNANLGCYIEIADENDTSKLHFSGYTEGEPQIFEMKESKKVDFLLIVPPNTTITNVTLSPMCMSADITDDTYEPCNKQTLTMPYTLRSANDIRDVVDFTKGSVTENTYNKVFTGAESFNLRTDTTGGGYYFEYYDFNLNAPKTDYDQNTVCNRLPVIPTLWNKNETGYMIASDKSIRLRIDEITTVAELQAKLKEWYDGGNPLTIITERATPIETPLTETELNAYRHLMTNKPNTTILSECEDTEITYYVNKPNAQAIGSLHEQINKDYLKLQQAIISTGGN